jgi:hypothetical protein
VEVHLGAGGAGLQHHRWLLHLHRRHRLHTKVSANIKIFFAGKTICRPHRMTQKKMVLGRVWPAARNAEMSPAV